MLCRECFAENALPSLTTETFMHSNNPSCSDQPPYSDGGRRRAVISGVQPEIDAGRFPAKRTVGETVVVEADVFCDGHDEPSCALLWRYKADSDWQSTPMAPIGQDRWRGQFEVDTLGFYRFTVLGWVDHFKTWRHDLQKRVAADQELGVDLRIGAEMIGAAAERAEAAGNADDAGMLTEFSSQIGGGKSANTAMSEKKPAESKRAERALDGMLVGLMARWPDQSFAQRYERELSVEVDRRRARFSSWYELFPRSTATEPGEHGTFEDCERRLSYIAEMGFDVVYLPPIHPIGREHRKGQNNARVAVGDDVGSPWAIGSIEGGHKAIHPKLGTLADFRQLVERARTLDIDIALDIAFQAAPDHPYVDTHPQWFQQRPDGTIQYAENPPKKYEDIYPFDFETRDWKALWHELESVVRYWCEQGVRIFRVDNPHTKPFAMWEWLIRSIKSDFAETIFLAEAFTRPKVMRRLAKLGFSQSYTYFAWRNDKSELTEYLTELTQTDVVDYMRPNFWPNTPDILTEFLQTGKRPAFMLRVALAATMTANYGIYGPAFELMEHVPAHPGSEEYLNSEKYQIRHWDLDAQHSLKDYIARLNRIRHDNPALQQNRLTTFHHVDNDWLMAFSKRTEERGNIILVVANLDVDSLQAGMVDLDLGELGLDSDQTFQVHDLIDDARYVWQGHRNYVELAPSVSPVHVFRIGHNLSSEDDFDDDV
jgi:starch synthase (maltosyl-transferring)